METDRKRARFDWRHGVAVALVVVVAVGAALSGSGGGDEGGEVTLRMLPTAAPTVTVTPGWWGDVEVSPLATATPTPGTEAGR